MTPHPDEAWEFRVPSDTLQEIKVMIILENLADMVDAAEFSRAIRWAISRFEVDTS